MRSVLGFCHSADAPTDRINSTSVSVSRMRGTFMSVTGWSVKSAAAMIGSAAFLLPDGSIVPESLWPPSTMYWIGGTGVLHEIGWLQLLRFQRENQRITSKARSLVE